MPKRSLGFEVSKEIFGEIGNLTDVDEIDEAINALGEADIEFIKQSDDLDFNPFLKVLSVFDKVVTVLDKTFRLPVEVDLTSEQGNAVMAGRCPSADERDRQLAEQSHFNGLFDYILNNKFDGRIEDFDPTDVTSAEYGEMVDELGRKVVDDAKETIPYDNPEGDEQVAEFLTNITGLANLALISGSRITMRKAVAVFEKIIEAKASEEKTVTKEAETLDELIIQHNKNRQDEKNRDALLRFKEGIGDDWPELLDAYITWLAAKRCIDILNVVLKSSNGGFNQELADIEREALVTRLGIYHITEVLGRKREEIGETQLTEQTPLTNPEELISQLDWTVLPEGEDELEKNAREIVAIAQERASEGREVHIDLERLNILRKLREAWGKDRCYYSRGSLKGRRTVRDNGHENADEYIVLVLQDLDDGGNVRYEHAVAESPIAGPNALYIFRGDTTSHGRGWREILSLTKKEARALGARRLKHSVGDGRGVVGLLSDRASILLACNPEEFYDIRFSQGGYRLSMLGRIASRAADTSI